MKLELEPGDREILRTSLGLAANASTAEIADVIKERLTTTAPAVGTLNTVERDATIAAAVRDGKFSADRAQHWTDKWDGDPEGTKRTIARLQLGVALPEVAAGPEYPIEWLRPPAAVGGSRIHGGGGD